VAISTSIIVLCPANQSTCSGSKWQFAQYGYRQLTKLVRQVAKAAGIHARRAERAGVTTDSVHAYPSYPNLVQALVRIDHPDQVWYCDSACGAVNPPRHQMGTFTMSGVPWGIAAATTILWPQRASEETLSKRFTIRRREQSHHPRRSWAGLEQRECRDHQ
jgi:hypothetical protein